MSSSMTSPKTLRFAAIVLAGLFATQSGAQQADLADVPLANSPSSTVLPNLMYILDDSGSMGWDYMPDNVLNLAGSNPPGGIKNCKAYAFTSPRSNPIPRVLTGTSIPASTTFTQIQCNNGEPPYYATGFNQIYYNPNVTYAAGVTSSGTSLGDQTILNAVTDKYLDSTTNNLATQYQEFVYCNTNSPTTANLTDGVVCKRNGINNVPGTYKYFLYWGATGTNVAYPVTDGYDATSFVYQKTLNSNPYYFNLVAHEFCGNINLTTCALANADGTAPSGFTVPAPVRYCKTLADAQSTSAITGTSGSPATPRCRKKFDVSNYLYPRYGRFSRVDIAPTTPSYVKGPLSVRTDCVSPTSCTYAEESKNFANWYSYYRTRLALMKTATGRAFLPIDDRYRVGFITINPNNPVTSDKFLKIAKFDSGQRGNWYSILYAQTTNGSTPLPQALSRVGRYYANKTSGINSGMSDDPVTYSCQQNFALLTTDGYWNQPSSADLSGSNIGNEDNSDSGFTKRADGAYDGNIAGASGTLADVAAYYYKNDLRTTGAVTITTNNVPTTAKDTAAHQHMVTFTLGLGLQGLMDYTADYETNATGDLAKIKAGGTGTCFWTSGVCNWPLPVSGTPTTLDDLWHAAVNGRGVYFSASDPNSLADGIGGALTALKVQTAAASASATSSPNITPTNNAIFSSTFRTTKWDGEIVAQKIDPSTGNVIPAITWAAQALLDARVTTTTDARTIWAPDASTSTKLKPFDWASLSASASGGIAAEQSYFTNKCIALSQCPLLTLAQVVDANNGQNLVGFLRGRTGFDGTSFRARDHVLGDSVNATPEFVKDAEGDFVDPVVPTFATFKTSAAITGRKGVLYIAANDGMLHAFDGANGNELWGYVPRIVMPNLYKLATDNWDVRHVYSVDGSPVTGSIYAGTSPAGAWKTILVAGLGKGGRGYYALDVTDPDNPKGLWEFCSDSTLCANSDSDMGYTFGSAVITKRDFDGKWVVLVTSGYNNVIPGTGNGYLYVLDAQTGAMLRKITTNVGNTTLPSGLAKLSGYSLNPITDNTTVFVYGGDLLGNMWRFDMRVDPPVVKHIASLTDSGGKPQSVTAKPEISVINLKPVIYIGTGRYLGPQDLSDPATLVPALPFAYQQSIYAIRDTDTDYMNVRSTGNLVQQTLTDNGTTRTVSANPVNYSSKNGWYIDLNPSNTSPGERVNLDVQIASGTLVVVTNVPNNSACTVGGDSFLYAFDFKTGQAVDTAPGGNAGTKITGQISVGNIVIQLPNKDIKTIVTGATGDKNTFAVPRGSGSGGARRLSWREIFQ